MTVAAVEEREPMIFPLIFMVVEAFKQDKPITVPPVPDEVNPVIVLPENVNVFVPVAELLIDIPVIAPVPVILVTVLFDKVFVVPSPQ